jgi:cell division protein FtsB
MRGGRTIRRNPRRMSAIEGTLTVIATILCFPCICLIGGVVVTKDAYRKAKEYERPEARQLREEKERKREIVRSTPKRMEGRLERHL